MKLFFCRSSYLALCIYLLIGTLVLGCSEAPTSFLDEEVGAQALSTSPSVPISNMAANDGAIVIKFDDTKCFLPAVDESGGVYIVVDIPCDVKVVNTPSGNINFLINKASVPNDFGKALPITFGNPVFIPCQIFTGSEFLLTEDYQFTVAANGNVSGVCHVSE